jgi:hypothetical protein
MPEIVICPQCERKLRVADDLRGKKVKCPSCGNNFLPGAKEPAEADSSFEEVDPVEETVGSAVNDRKERRRPRRPRYQGKPHRGALVLVLGFVLPPLAWVMGNQDLAEMDAGRMDRSGLGLTRAGRVLGIIGSVVWILLLVCGVSGFLFFLLIGHRASRAAGL